jgi:hypothetical protein
VAADGMRHTAVTAAELTAPMTTATAGATPDFDLATPVRTDDDVLRRIDLLLDENARQLRSVVLLFLDADGIQLPVAVPIDDVPERPDPVIVGNLCWIIAEALKQYPGGSALVVLTRPEAAPAGDADRYWARNLDRFAREHGAPIRMLCLATLSGVQRLTVDGPGDPGPASTRLL